ncbi:thioredoxin Y1, chloroplastic-like [Telopea speciosissima]|uniref:thioredoxin Y1, chloroplastic-like n=1 Tax=Telopea speciosissima TaxID=54955 RepID=UPI001CC66DF9|nr:thioredoxin Y1, chloroplastic-like [Telopea speciosissima]XP_043719193.1 thioredoxin Y1, chloroplastic-like [Telopea speciosissima]XP_043719194.1 thioredoxin Y1, chloroplastic-like [Telopea speciosissima]XP_043719195.1 thioredoxin Y1, chloroplastic-like [Telopea speciosissima]
MAISASIAAIPSFSFERSTTSLSSNLSSSTSLQFSLRLRRLRVGNWRVVVSRPKRQILPKVEAKKQSFSSFDDLLANSDKPVLVDFYATWCGPCQFMAPVLEQVSGMLKDKIQIVKIDTEKYPSIADKYRIEALPTFIIFKDGEPCNRFEGALTADQLVERIETVLKVKQ